jgi:hypothetical protein
MTTLAITSSRPDPENLDACEVLAHIRCSCCCADRLWRRGDYCRDDHEEANIMIDCFIYTDARLHWITAPTLLLLHCRVVIMIHDLIPTNFLRWYGRNSASVTYPILYSGIRVIMHSLRPRSCTYTWYVMVRFMWWIYWCMTWLDQLRLKLIASCGWIIISRSLSVMCATYLYRLKSASGLTIYIVSILSQQIEVMCCGLLMKLRHSE